MTGSGRLVGGRVSLFDCLKGPAERLYDKKCTVYEYITGRDTETGIDYAGEKVKYTDVPCRISYKTISAANETDTGSSITQSISLFCSPEYDILPGSKISCHGIVYKASGEPAKYVSHQRIELTLEREWA